MKYLRNTWYMAAWAEELNEHQLLARTFLDEPIVLYRRQDGQAIALYDECPHRFAPLSLGRLNGDHLACGYHGLQFDCHGRCAINPFGSIPKAAAVKSYPVVERYGILWIWMGDADRAQAELIPDLSTPYAIPEAAQSKDYLPTRANYQLIADNIADLSHVDYLHPTTLGGGSFTRTKAHVEEQGNEVHLTWVCEDEVPMPAYDMFMPQPGTPADLYTEVTWKAPGIMPLNIACTPTGQAKTAGLQTHNVHIVTPETETTSHYWFWLTRSYRCDDVGLTKKRHGLMLTAFTTEDKVMLEAQQKRIGNHGDLLAKKPVLLTTDGGAMRIRRILNRMLESESVVVPD
ncbi:aromatic ring-hydroxylating dioxygenase subunit alpha [Eoetvoesiella caeni]